MTGDRLTDNQRQVLVNLYWNRDVLRDRATEAGWMRPMDIGGSNASHHSGTLAGLVKRGLVDRKRRYVGISSGSWTYRISEAGVALVERLRSRRREESPG